MMPEIFKKKCVNCLAEFESKSNRNCSFCGSNEWIFIDEEGRQRIPIAEAIAKKRQAKKNMQRIENAEKRTPPMTDERARDLIDRFYPFIDAQGG